MNRKKEMSNSGQLNAFEQPRDVQVAIKEEIDLKGRTRADIAEASKSLNQKVLDSIVYDPEVKQFRIEGDLADDWIDSQNDLYKEKYSHNRGYH